MKRLFFLNLLAVLLFVSCASADNSSSYLIRAEESADIEERIGIYLSQIEENSDDMRAYYNLAYLYLYQEDYLKAEEILKRAISLFPEHFRFYSALLYLYERTGDFLEELCGRRDLEDKNILISTHGAAMTALLNRIKGNVTVGGFWKDEVPPNCSVTMVKVHGGQASIVEEGVIYYREKVRKWKTV